MSDTGLTSLKSFVSFKSVEYSRANHNYKLINVTLLKILKCFFLLLSDSVTQSCVIEGNHKKEKQNNNTEFEMLKMPWLGNTFHKYVHIGTLD